MAYAVRYGSRWTFVRASNGQYTTGCWFADQSAEGLEYVLSGEGVRRHRSINKLLVAHGGSRGPRSDLHGRRAYEILGV